jgi:hypothetical protein
MQLNNDVGSSDSTTVTFKPSTLWTLLDPSICSMALDSAEHNAGRVADGEDAASMQLSMQFVHPLDQEQDNMSIESTDVAYTDDTHEQNFLGNPFTDDFFEQFTFDEEEWVPSMP